MSVATAGEARTRDLARPIWLRLRFWVPVAVLVVAGALATTLISGQSDRALDPKSASHAGSRALAAVFAHFGITVQRTTDLDTAAGAGPDAAVVVPDPDSYSSDQLRRLAAAHAGRLVLAAASARAARAAGSTAEPTLTIAASDYPSCADPGATAAGFVDLPSDTLVYRSPGDTTCYGGAVVLGPVSVLGSSRLLRNDEVGNAGVAALDVNVITDNRSLRHVVWLLSGSEATATGAPTFWQLFPDSTRRAFLWLVAVGVLLILWRGRRLGPVVREPLPVVVRSAEVVEGHGRLYRRAGARDRAAVALRAAALDRLHAPLGLPRSAGAAEVATALAASTGRAPGELLYLLAGPPPGDDRDLLRLVHDLDALEATAGVPSRPKGTQP